MSSRPELRLDWCSHAAAKYAVEHWHYSKRMPVGKMVHVGAWEDGQFIGVVLFGRGANNHIGRPYGLPQVACCELVRVALTFHRSPVSRIVAITLRLLREQSPGLRLVVSYADPSQGHIGGIYQAGGWIYVGVSTGTHQLKMPDGTVLHKRVARARYGSNDSAVLGGEYVYPEQKHKYLYPLDAAMRAQIAPLAKPYPKRPRATSIEDAPASHAGEGGSQPTVALHAEAS